MGLARLHDLWLPFEFVFRVFIRSQCACALFPPRYKHMDVEDLAKCLQQATDAGSRIKVGHGMVQDWNLKIPFMYAAARIWRGRRTTRHSMLICRGVAPPQLAYPSN